MIELTQHLVDYKLFSGPPGESDYISNSGLSEIKRVLISGMPFLGNEVYLHEGSEVHSRHLEKRQLRKLDQDTEERISGMLKSLNQHKFVKKLMASSIKEVTTIKKVHGANCKVVLDIRGIKTLRRLGADLKTTSAKTEQQFIKLAIEKYDYLRQGWIYKQAEDLDEFFFIGIQKQKPHNVYILDQNNYEKEERAAAREGKFLIDFYKQHGRVARPGIACPPYRE